MASYQAGYTRKIVTATNREKALEYYQQLRLFAPRDQVSYPCAVFLDLDMPVIGGWEFLDYFTKDFYSGFPETKVFIVSSSVNLADQGKVKDYPCVAGFVSKPITVELLAELLQGPKDPSVS